MSNAVHRFNNDTQRRSDDHDRQRFLTPEYVLEPVRKLFGGRIGLDPCTEQDNPTDAEHFYCLPADGCSLPWDASSVFCNPPYGKARERWVDRCIATGMHARVVLLIPAHPDTKAFQRALNASSGCVFIRGRLRFGRPRPPTTDGYVRQELSTHPSALIGFGVDVNPLAELGVVVRPTIRDLFREGHAD